MPIAPNAVQTRQHTETLRGCRSRREAAGALAVRQGEVFRGDYKPRETRVMSMNDFVPIFLEKKSELRSLAYYKRAFRYMAPTLGKKALSTITTADCEEYKRIRTHEGAAPATVRNEMRYLQSLFIEARKLSYMSGDPVADISFSVHNERSRTLGKRERESLFATVNALPANDVMRPFVYLLFFTGMRLANALALKWEDVDIDQGFIRLTKTKTNREYRPPITAQLLAELKRWRRFKFDKGIWVFPGITPHTHLGDWVMRDRWKVIMKDAGIVDFNPHDMRHNIVSSLKAAGAGNKAIGQVTGQTSNSIIDRYDHPEFGSVKGFMDRVEVLTAFSADVADNVGKADS